MFVNIWICSESLQMNNKHKRGRGFQSDAVDLMKVFCQLQIGGCSKKLMLDKLVYKFLFYLQTQ